MHLNNMLAVHLIMIQTHVKLVNMIYIFMVSRSNYIFDLPPWPVYSQTRSMQHHCDCLN